MQANRAFLRRAVRFLVAQGVHRFLDLGSGIPTVDNTHVMISHGTDENVPPDVRDQLLRLYQGTTNPVRVRKRAEFERFFDGLELLQPGIAYMPSWRPEAADDLLVDQPEGSCGYAAVARKP